MHRYAFLLALVLVLHRAALVVPANRGGLLSLQEPLGDSMREFDEENYKGTLEDLFYSPKHKAVIGAFTSGLVQVSTSPSIGKGDVKTFFPNSTFADEFIDMVHDEKDDILYILTARPQLEIIRIDGKTFQQVDDPLNPFDIIVGDPHNVEMHIHDGERALYVITHETGVGRLPLPLTKDSQLTFSYLLNDTISVSSYLSEADNLFFIGGSNGTFYGMSTGDDFPAMFSYHVPNTTLPESEDYPITQFVREPSRPYLYLIFGQMGEFIENATASRVVRYDLKAHTVSELVKLGDQDTFITEAVIDPLGLLYLSTQTEGGHARVIQVSLEPFQYEGEILLEGAEVYSLAFDPSGSRQLYATYFRENLDPAIVAITGAFACEADCYGHGTCALRACKCDSDSRPKPWCGEAPPVPSPVPSPAPSPAPPSPAGPATSEEVAAMPLDALMVYLARRLTVDNLNGYLSPIKTAVRSVSVSMDGRTISLSLVSSSDADVAVIKGGLVTALLNLTNLARPRIELVDVYNVTSGDSTLRYRPAVIVIREGSSLMSGNTAWYVLVAVVVVSLVIVAIFLVIYVRSKKETNRYMPFPEGGDDDLIDRSLLDDK